MVTLEQFKAIHSIDTLKFNLNKESGRNVTSFLHKSGNEYIMVTTKDFDPSNTSRYVVEMEGADKATGEVQPYFVLTNKQPGGEGVFTL